MEEISSNQMIDIEEHFKVSAGPGAGKTHWLICHIQNTLRQSTRLAKTAKIGCITYTNTGVNEIQQRLGWSLGRVDVATIHSFLYRNIVAPYAFLIKDDADQPLINMRKLDGHDEHIPLPNLVYKWQKKTNQGYLCRYKEVVYKCLMDLDWQFDPPTGWSILPRRKWKIRINSDLSIRKKSLFDYKRLYWNNGIVHHEDVLYFAYRILNDHGEILNFIRRKYPYIFIDEFQDTHPLQTAILKLIAAKRTIVGVVGDPAQSIYKFQGAKRQDFLEFSLPGMKEYFISGNRRSTGRIIDLLNTIRGDEIEQKNERGINGGFVKLFIGDKIDAQKRIASECADLAILARSNQVVSQIKKSTNASTPEIWILLRQLDSNGERQNLIHKSLSAVELVFCNRWQDARKEVMKLFRAYADGTSICNTKWRDYSIILIQMIMAKWKEFSEGSIRNYNNYLYNFIEKEFGLKIGAKITRGKYKDFTEKHTCQELLQGLSISDDESLVRTIHKAKGAEFDRVLVIFEDEEEIKNITEPNIESEKDDSRIYYVGLSRARDYLFITVPALSEETKREITNLGVKIIQMNS